LIWDGRAADAIPQFKQAIRINPRNPENYNRYYGVGYASMFLGQYEEAVAWFDKSLAALPSGSNQNIAHGTTLNRGFVSAGMAAAQALAGHVGEAHLSAVEASRIWPTLTARSYYQYPITNPVAAAEMSHMRDGLRMAGIRDHADEDADFGIASDNVLHTDYEAPTPTTLPGATTIRTPDLAAFVKQRRPLVLDSSPLSVSIPGAIGLLRAGIGGGISDQFQDGLGQNSRRPMGTGMRR
jgi:adenylate cyclase